ncbi:MAG: ABC transporter permease [Clostridiales bacterium]|nr:MAG: ABC transporter permease [Clostridiales bacterium]
MNNKRFNLYDILVPLIAVVASLAAGAIIFALLGKNPITAYYSILQGSGFVAKAKYGGSQSMLTDFASFVNAWTPLLLASLAVAIALKAGLFNIGVAGQMLLSGFIATITIGYLEMHWLIAKPLALIVGLIVGALVGSLIGYLKHRFNINEVVSSIMLNYIIQYVVGFFITTRYINPISRQSNPVTASARWTLTKYPVGNLKMDIPLGIVVALIAAFAIYILVEKTTLGYEIKAVGFGKRAARHAGINIYQTTIKAMALSGGLAGLAGVTYYMGYYGTIMPRTLAPMGFDAIAVALLGNTHPIGIIASSFLISIISSGSTYMRSITGVEAEIAAVIIGIILLFSACGVFIKQVITRKKV